MNEQERLLNEIHKENVYQSEILKGILRNTGLVVVWQIIITVIIITALVVWYLYYKF
jgi:hypothetical protein